MTKDKKTNYAPNLRNYLDAPLNKTKCFSKKDYIELPDNVTNPIVANNISNAEFDYTYNRGEDIPTTENKED
ncbi:MULTISPECIES: hypothetical protein [Clostridium]|uniref:Uncharacterized protein n=1 Tax=Clostridium senegalense TaxID=1465809 RepID=A0A6M0GYU4_9CLOT|nr:MULTISPECIES: hypothetical protein [Clostridium]NEU03736.1 hypothetical protein [Clostridium senegalense]